MKLKTDFKQVSHVMQYMSAVRVAIFEIFTPQKAFVLRWKLSLCCF